MTARALNGKGICEGCGTDFIACAYTYHCLAGCQEPETFYCGDCGNVEVEHDGDDCTECKSRFERQRKSVKGLVKVLSGRVA